MPQSWKTRQVLKYGIKPSRTLTVKVQENALKAYNNFEDG